MNIDPTALDPYREAMGAGADSFVIELIDTFLNTTGALVDALYASIASADVKVFTRSAHTLKSNSAIFGAQLLSNLCYELETAGKTAELATLLPKVDQVKLEYQQVCSDLAALRQELV